MGIAVVDVVLSTNNSQNEAVLLGQIYDFITGLWDGIECSVVQHDGTVVSPGTASDMDWWNNAISSISFELKSGVILKFETYPSSGTTTRGYNVYAIVNDVIIGQVGSGTTRHQGCFKFCGVDGWVGDGVSPYNGEIRKYTFSKYVSDDMFVIWLGSHSVSSWKDSEYCFVGLKDTSGNWHYSFSTTIEGANVYDANGSNPAIKSPMFSYEARTGYLDFISHSSFVSGSTKAFTSTDIYDCTTVNFGDTLSLKDGANFLAIGAHSMVKLDN